MLPSSVQRVLATVPDDAVVLDIGGWGKPLPRADWVMDLMPWETRGLYGYETHDPERFTRETWIQRDLCDRAPFPFADGAVDFVTCSHTLEDIRDPIWVCEEMQQIAKAGYIETPSRLEEQTFGIQGPWTGWAHHRWLVEAVDGRLEFTFKAHTVCGRDGDRFPSGFLDRVDPEDRVLQFWWEGSFECTERIFLTAEETDAHTGDFVAEELRRRGMAAPAGRPSGAIRALRTRARSALARRR